MTFPKGNSSHHLKRWENSCKVLLNGERLSYAISHECDSHPTTHILWDNWKCFCTLNIFLIIDSFKILKMKMLPALCQKHLISFVKGSFFSIFIYSEQVNPTCRRTSIYESETSYTSLVTIIITNSSQNCKPYLQF